MDGSKSTNTGLWFSCVMQPTPFPVIYDKAQSPVGGSFPLLHQKPINYSQFPIRNLIEYQLQRRVCGE